MLRRGLLAWLLALSLPVAAQQPPKLEPLPAPPPPPPGIQEDTLGERPIRITPGVNEQIEETVIDGRRVLRVTTPGGAVYYLRGDLGEAGLPREGLDQRIRVPLWVVHEF
ncbi:MAG: DUF2782 domain-containing protein [Betaproteobacteria bacterium]|nr:DUF2782 domain-containing protein [Betaproteobacteria bacterium]MBI2960954.1 DUF2782 domain-containing protein [Betaproteobacteria bacterium]